MLLRISQCFLKTDFESKCFKIIARWKGKNKQARRKRAPSLFGQKPKEGVTVDLSCFCRASGKPNDCVKRTKAD